MIKQHTKEWIEAKQKKIGASEIFALVQYYCPQELEKVVGLEQAINISNENPFISAFGLYHKIKSNFKVELSNVNDLDFGNCLEPYIVHAMNKEDEVSCVMQTKEFIIREDIHPLYACSPDAYCSSEGNISFDGVDIKGNGLAELKTIRNQPFMKDGDYKSGAKWKYIFQNQYQLIGKPRDFGVIVIMCMKEYSMCNDYNRGYIKGLAEQKEYAKIEELTDLHTYLYPNMPKVQVLCLLALSRFQDALDKNLEPEPKCRQDEAVIKGIYPEHFGSVEIENQIIEALLDEKMAAAKEKTKIEKELLVMNNKIRLLLANHQEVVCGLHRVYYDKRGYLQHKEKNYF